MVCKKFISEFRVANEGDMCIYYTSPTRRHNQCIFRSQRNNRSEKHVFHEDSYDIVNEIMKIQLRYDIHGRHY